MRKLLTFGAAILSLALYMAPFAVSHAGANPPGISTPALAQNPPAPTLYMRITAYASVPNETDNTPFLTANGMHVRDGIIASNILPFGTKVQIPTLFGKKVFTVEDRMSTKIKNTVDIWMPTVKSAIVFGVHNAGIVILSEPGNTPNQLSLNSKP